MIAKGRKNKWESHVKPKLKSICTWRRMGLLEKEVCERLGVGLSNFARYKLSHGDLRDALKEGKHDADANVINALYQCAIGFEFEETETIVSKDAKGNQVGRVQLKRTKRRRTPSVTAQIFYLKNRCPETWRDVQGREHSGPDGRPLQAQPPVIHAYIPDNHRPRKEPNGNGHRRTAVTTAIKATVKR